MAEDEIHEPHDRIRDRRIRIGDNSTKSRQADAVDDEDEAMKGRAGHADARTRDGARRWAAPAGTAAWVCDGWMERAAGAECSTATGREWQWMEGATTGGWKKIGSFG